MESQISLKSRVALSVNCTKKGISETGPPFTKPRDDIGGRLHLTSFDLAAAQGENFE